MTLWGVMVERHTSSEVSWALRISRRLISLKAYSPIASQSGRATAQNSSYEPTQALPDQYGQDSPSVPPGVIRGSLRPGRAPRRLLGARRHTTGSSTTPSPRHDVL